MLHKLLPGKREKQILLDLKKQVEQEKTNDENLAYLMDNLESTSKVIFKMLKFLV